MAITFELVNSVNVGPRVNSISLEYNGPLAENEILAAFFYSDNAAGQVGTTNGVTFATAGTTNTDVMAVAAYMTDPGIITITYTSTIQQLGWLYKVTGVNPQDPIGPVGVARNNTSGLTLIIEPSTEQVQGSFMMASTDGNDTEFALDEVDGWTTLQRDYGPASILGNGTYALLGYNPSPGNVATCRIVNEIANDGSSGIQFSFKEGSAGPAFASRDGVDSANIASIDGVPVGNIASVDGVPA